MHLNNITLMSVANPTIFAGYHKILGHIRIEYRDHVLSFYKHEEKEPFLTSKQKVLPFKDYVSWNMIDSVVEDIKEESIK